jgi:hypothetical protein
MVESRERAFSVEGCQIGSHPRPSDTTMGHKPTIIGVLLRQSCQRWRNRL